MRQILAKPLLLNISTSTEKQKHRKNAPFYQKKRDFSERLSRLIRKNSFPRNSPKSWTTHQTSQKTPISDHRCDF